MERNKLVELYKKYNLEKTDVFKHQHYVIITRQGIEKIQAQEQIKIKFDVIKLHSLSAAFLLNLAARAVTWVLGSKHGKVFVRQGKNQSIVVRGFTP